MKSAARDLSPDPGGGVDPTVKAETTQVFDPPEMTPRVCRWCGNRFMWPKGSKQVGCARCQLQLFPRA